MEHKPRMTLGLRAGPSGEGGALAEAAGLEFVFLPMGAAPGHDPLCVAAFLVGSTRRVGLIAETPLTWAPFHTARALASFDLLSAGRCGWAPARAGLGADQATEHLAVVMQLFDSWADDALVLDKAQAVFADREKVRRIRHSGRFYTVDGPLNTPRPPQGRPVLLEPLHAVGAYADVALAEWDDIPGGVRPAAALLLIRCPLRREANASSLADRLVSAFAEGACDGFLLEPADPITDTAWLIAHVLPRLTGAGLREGGPDRGDLRARLGLGRPANRFFDTAQP